MSINHKRPYKRDYALTSFLLNTTSTDSMVKEDHICWCYGEAIVRLPPTTPLASLSLSPIVNVINSFDSVAEAGDDGYDRDELL